MITQMIIQKLVLRGGDEKHDFVGLLNDLLVSSCTAGSYMPYIERTILNRRKGVHLGRKSSILNPNLSSSGEWVQMAKLSVLQVTLSTP